MFFPQVAFDKHWNLALVDVDESYVRKRFPKSSIFDVDDITKKFDSLDVKTSDKKKKTKKIVKKEEVVVAAVVVVVVAVVVVVVVVVSVAVDVVVGASAL